MVLKWVKLENRGVGRVITHSPILSSPSEARQFAKNAGALAPSFKPLKVPLAAQQVLIVFPLAPLQSLRPCQ